MTSWREKRAELKAAGEIERLAKGETQEPMLVGTPLVVECGFAAEKETKKGGVRIVLGWDVVEPPEYKSRRVFTSHNVVCPGSTKSEEIALEILTRISLASGLDEVFEDPSELEGKVLECKVSGHDHYNGDVREELDQWAPSEVKGNAPTFSAAADDDDLPF